MNRVWVISPKRKAVYGQDYFVKGLKPRLKNENIFIMESPYSINEVKDGDVVVTHNPDDKNEYEFLRKLKERKKIELVSHIHCHPSYYDNSVQIKEVFKLSSQIICPFKYVDPNFIGDKNVDIVPNAISSDEFQGPEICPYGWRLGSQPIFGHVGRINSAKGQQLLASFALKLKELQAKLVLQFPANDIDFSRATAIKSIDPESIYLHPDLNRDSPRPVRWFDICLSFSLSEFAPLVVLESLMAGTPVLATDSTAFYDELKVILEGKLSNSFHLVPLPSRLHRGNTARSELMLTYDETITVNDSIVDSIQSLMNWKNRYSGNLRNGLAVLMKESSYEANKAYEKCITLYRSYLSTEGDTKR